MTNRADSARQTNPHNSGRGNETRAAPVVQTRVPYNIPAGDRVGGNIFHGNLNPYTEIRSHGQGVPNPRVASAPNPNPAWFNVGFGQGAGSPYHQQHQPQRPHHQQPQYQQPYPYMPQGNLHPSGVTNPYLNADTLPSNVQRQPTAEYGLPPPPRRIASASRGATVPKVPGAPPLPANSIRTGFRSGTGTAIEALRRVQDQLPIPREQLRQQRFHPEFTVTHGRAFNSASAFGSPPNRPSPTGYGPASAFEPSNYGNPPNNGSASSYQPFPAFESPESRIARGLPPHLTQPEPLAPQRPAVQQNPDHTFLHTDDGAGSGERCGQGRIQATATPTGGASRTGAPQGMYTLLGHRM